MWPGSASTIEQRLASCGRTTGFDYLRISLALSIIGWHTIVLSYGPAAEAVAWQSTLGVAYRFVLPMFFALSGYLVAGSLDRCRSIGSFFGLRVLRIVPALAVEVALSALIFGPVFTTASLSDYLSSSELYSYFLNVTGNIHYTLPGLFPDNPLPRVVNNQLWTIPSELRCYLVLGGLAAASLIRSRWLLLVIALVGQVLWAVHGIGIARIPITRSPLASGEALIIAFLAGMLIHLFQKELLLHWSLFAACCMIGWLVAALPNGGNYLPFPAAYMTVYLGLLNPAQNALLKSGDYSYGLYLYGYPIQQAIASIGPQTRHWWVSLGVALPVALAVAVFSWRYVEKPALGARHRVTAMETWMFGILQTRPIAIPIPTSIVRWVRRIMKWSAVIAVGLLINGTTSLGSVIIVGVLVAAALIYVATSSDRKLGDSLTHPVPLPRPTPT